MQTTYFILDNGFKVIQATDRSNPLISLQLYVQMGSAWENQNEAGFTHFLEHLIFKSTKEFADNSIMEYINDLGGNINAYTEYDSTCIYITIPAKYIDEGLYTLSQLSRFAEFSDSEFQFEKKVVLEELKEYKNNPEEDFLDMITENYFSTNPYRNPIIGNENTITNASMKNLRKFYHKYYSPRNCFLIITGDFEKDSLKQKVEEHFAEWNDIKVTKRERTIHDFPKKAEFRFFKKQISKDFLAFVLPDLSDYDEEAYPMSVITKVFATGKNSRLYDRLFTEEKLIDAIRVHSFSGINDGASVITIMVRNNTKLTKIIAIFLEELKQFFLHGINQNEMDEHIQELLYFHKYSSEYMESYAFSLGNEELTLGFEEFYKYPEQMKKLTRSQINNTIKKYFHLKYLHIYHCGKNTISENNIKKYLAEEYTLQPKVKVNQNYYETKLDNGLRIMFKKVIGKPTVGVSLSSNVSQLNEDEKNRGTNLLTSSLLLYGNKKRTYKQLINYCTSNGINFGINAASETTTIRAKCFSENLPITLELISDVVLHPGFPKEELQHLKQSYKNNLDRTKDYPEHYANFLWKRMFFGKNSNLINREGSKTSLNKITSKRIKQWYSQYYQPENMVLAIVGDFNFDKALFIAQKQFRFPDHEFDRSAQEAIIKSSPKKILKTKTGSDQAIINLGGWACSASDKEKNTAFHVLSQILGGDANSILFRELREKRGLAYSVNCSFTSTFDHGYWHLTTVVDRSNQQITLKLIFSILDQIKENGISEKDLIRTKNFIRGQRLINEESVSSQAQVLSVLESIGLGYQYYQKRDERLNRVDIDILHELSKEYFDINNLFIHILS